MQVTTSQPDSRQVEGILPLIKGIYSELDSDAELPDDAYRIAPISQTEWIIQFDGQSHENSTLQLRVIPFDQHDGFQIVQIDGSLAKAGGEWMRFITKMAIPGQENESSPNGELGEDALIDLKGYSVDSSGGISYFEDQHPDWETYLAECSSCGQPSMPASYYERKVGEDRCWQCTGVAASVGLIVSGLAAWVSQPLMQVLGVEGGDVLLNIAYFVFGLGVAYTGWRTAFWGYLPYQNWIAWWLENRPARSDQSTAKRRET